MERPNPDDLLAQVKNENAHRGKLKIFFGAVAGVGKTYSMLESARHRKKEGIDIVIGYVDTHKRVETEALLAGLEILPLQTIPYKNIELREFDVDAALTRNPHLILVDELAHTNVPGARHTKRWQDIEELLDKGIDVYTTLNVQHCESVNDIVAQVTGVRVRETVPDTFVENADEIELVDLPSEELLKRLKEEKVYLGDQAELAAQHFFQPGNLIALRQLALHYTERNVDSQLMIYKKTHSISKIWNVRDRLLVCISTNPEAIRLIRAGKRIASNLGAEWIVAYVDTYTELHAKDKNKLNEMLYFAEKLGAQAATLRGKDIAETVISYARTNNVTTIIAGKPGKLRFREYIYGSVIYRLARKCGEIDLYLLSGDVQEDSDTLFKIPIMTSFPWKNLGWTLTTLMITTAINFLLSSHMAHVNLVMIYLLAVTFIAFRYGRRMSIFASFISVILFDFCFVPPYYSFAVADVQYIITFAVMLVVGLIISHLTGKMKIQNIAMRKDEDRIQTLYTLNRNLAKSSYPGDLFKIALKHIEEFFKCRAIIFVPDKNNNLSANFGEIANSALILNELAVAQWVFEHKKNAGKGTDTLPGSNGIYLPFTGSEKTVGVLGIYPNDDKQFMDPEQIHMLEMFVNQTAVAVEGAQLATAALDAESKMITERLRSTILTTFSFELPEQLTSISMTISELLKPENINDELKRNELLQKIHHEIDHLNNLIVELPKIIDSATKTF